MGLGLNKTTGNMYDFITHTWNPIKGKCSHDCVYCYMKRFGNLKPVRMVGKELKTDLGSGNFIFVGSSTDMWADDVNDLWIQEVLNICECFNSNKYLFQSKNPDRINDFFIPPNSVIGTTIESNFDDYQISKAPPMQERANGIDRANFYGYETMITIEPILEFDLKLFVEMIKTAKPTWINIGADSQKQNLPEPSFEKVKELIAELSKFTEVRQKKNLDRLRK